MGFWYGFVNYSVIVLDKVSIMFDIMLEKVRIFVVVCGKFRVKIVFDFLKYLLE